MRSKPVMLPVMRSLCRVRKRSMTVLRMRFAKNIMPETVMERLSILVAAKGRAAISAFLFLPVFSSVFPAYFSSFAAPLLFHPLEESDGRADKVELLAELVLKEPLVAKVQSASLVGEEHEGRRGAGRLRHVVKLHLPAGRRGPTVKVHLRKPPVELAGRDAPPALGGHLVNYSV